MDTPAPAIATIVRGQMKLWNTLWKWREKQTIDFENRDLAEFVEEMVKGIIALNPSQVSVVAVNEDAGLAATQYYNCGISDKGHAITHILEDIFDDFIQNNAERIRSIILDDDIDGEDDEIE